MTRKPNDGIVVELAPAVAAELPPEVQEVIRICSEIELRRLGLGAPASSPYVASDTAKPQSDAL